jgi:hypothetical protein
MKAYYPTYHLGCNPIHEVRNWAYVRKLIRAARRGEEINPILIEGEIGSGSLLAGTHRAAANDLMMMLGGEPLISVVNMDEIEASEELIEAVENSDYEMIDLIWDRK